MLKTKQDFVDRIHLILSVLIVVPVAFIYGFSPESQFEIFLSTNDEHNAFKAIMGLYIGFSIIWILGLFKTNYLKTALITNIVFMLGLGFGRVLSLVLDGIPTIPFVFGAIGELTLGLYGVWVLNKYNKKP